MNIYVGTLTVPWIKAGSLIRGQIRQVFAEVERNGGKAQYFENKGFIESVFSDVKLEGPENLIRWAYSTIQELCEDD